MCFLITREFFLLSLFFQFLGLPVSFYLVGYMTVYFMPIVLQAIFFPKCNPDQSDHTREGP